MGFLFNFQRLGQSLLERRNAAVLQFRHARQILRAARRIQVLARALQLLLDVRGALDRGLLRLPHLLEIRVFLFQRLQRVFQGAQALARRLVGFLLERLALDLQLNDAPVQFVERLGLGIDFHADQRSRLIDQIDGLVGQLPIRDVAMRQRRRRHDGRIRDFHAMMHFVALFQAAQDRDGVFHRRLIDHHLLEAPLERRVFLDVFAIFIERGGADAVQLAARQCGLQHIARVHRALGLAGAHHGVQFVDEQNDLAFLFGQIVENRFQALLELAAKFRTRDQRAHIERRECAYCAGPRAPRR